jgi:hypothetical protein
VLPSTTTSHNPPLVKTGHDLKAEVLSKPGRLIEAIYIHETKDVATHIRQDLHNASLIVLVHFYEPVQQRRKDRVLCKSWLILFRINGSIVRFLQENEVCKTQ